MSDVIAFPVPVPTARPVPSPGEGPTITSSAQGDAILTGIEVFERAVLLLSRRGVAVEDVGVALSIVQAGHARANGLPLDLLRAEGRAVVAELDGEDRS